MLRLASVLAALVLMLSPAVAQPLDDPHHPCNGCAVPAEPDLPDPGEVDDVVMGCAFPEGATGSNIARQIALRAGCPVTTSGVTVNRFCSSGLQTIALAAQRIVAGEADVLVAGGLESISCVQNQANRHMGRDPWLEKNKPEIYWNMLQTAEMVAKRYKIDREAQDRYGVESQLRAAAAQKAGRFDQEIVPFVTEMTKAEMNDKKEVVRTWQEEVTLAERFASGDNYYSNAESSDQGHMILTSSISNTLAKLIPLPTSYIRATRLSYSAWRSAGSSMAASSLR